MKQRVRTLLQLAVVFALVLSLQPLMAYAQGTLSDKDNIVDTAVAAGDFTTLVELVQAAGLAETLTGDGPFTVFAPTDEAFAAVPPDVLEALAADPDALQRVLLYHVVPGRLIAALISDGKEVATAEGSNVLFSFIDGVKKVNGATITAKDIQASNGVIHVIDSVILPADIAAALGVAAEEAAATPEATEEGAEEAAATPEATEEATATPEATEEATATAEATEEAAATPEATEEPAEEAAATPEATEEPAEEAAAAEATEEAAATPEATEEPTEEAAAEAAATPEATEEPAEEAAATPEATEEPAEEVAAEVAATPEATEEPAEEVAAVEDAGAPESLPVTGAATNGFGVLATTLVLFVIAGAAVITRRRTN